MAHDSALRESEGDAADARHLQRELLLNTLTRRIGCRTYVHRFDGTAAGLLALDEVRHWAEDEDFRGFTQSSSAVHEPYLGIFYVGLPGPHWIGALDEALSAEQLALLPKETIGARAGRQLFRGPV